MDRARRVVILRQEGDGADIRYLGAYVDENGACIDGQDLGPGTSLVSSDGEYEWFQTIAAGPPADRPVGRRTQR